MAAIDARPLRGAVVEDWQADVGGNLLDVVYLKSTGKIALAQRDGTAAEANAVGIAVGTDRRIGNRIPTSDAYLGKFSAGDVVTVVTSGPVGGFSGLTVGADYYISATPGDIVTTKSTTSGHHNKKIGVAHAADILFVESGNEIDTVA